MYEGRRQIVVDNLRRYLNGEELMHQADPVKGY
jgi:hypothetical protein